MIVRENSKALQAEQRRRRELIAGCTRFLSGHREPPAAVSFSEMAEYCRTTGAEADRYGTGDFLNGFEEEIARLLGKEAAVFMPSGVMAQQIALRIAADRSRLRSFALHATSHLEVNEHLAYRHLQGLQGILLGKKSAPWTAGDLAACREPLAAMLLELPYRRLGGVLPSWEELESILKTAKAKRIWRHLDGARLWESQPYYGKPLARICQGFDSVYVSFYKGIGGITGSMLLGPAAFIREARIWQRRHGGNLYQLHPYAVSAKLNFDKRRDRFPEYWTRAKSLAAALGALKGVEVRPATPQTPMFHLHLPGSVARLSKRRDLVARRQKFWLGGLLLETEVPGRTLLEVAVGDATLKLSDAEVVAAFRKLLEAP